MAPPLAKPWTVQRGQLARSGSAEEADKQRNDEKRQKQKEQDLSNTGRRSGDTTKTKYACYQGNDEKDECIVQHR